MNYATIEEALRRVPGATSALGGLGKTRADPHPGRGTAAGAGDVDGMRVRAPRKA